MKRPAQRDSCCGPEAAPLTGDTDTDLAALCRALGHPARVQIVRLLVAQGTCISGDLAEAVGLAPSTVSQHLGILKDAGLIQGTIDGPRRCYCVNAKTLSDLERLFAAARMFNPHSTEKCDEVLEPKLQVRRRQAKAGRA